MDRWAERGVIAGGVAGLGVWLLCRWIIGPSRSAGVGVEDALFEDFRAHSRGVVRGQWQVLLDGQDRLPGGFRDDTRIARPHSSRGSLLQGSDLAKAVDAAAAPGGAPRLLIEGLPGHGKTVALLDAAQHLTDEHDAAVGIPVVFNLGSWGQHDDDLAAWMVRDLCAATGPVPGADETVTRWVKAGWISPMLDGLDEIVDRDSRWRCVQAINRFIHRAPAHTAVVVASRSDEYTAVTTEGADRLAVNAAITLEKLRPELVMTQLRGTAAGAYLAELVEASPTHPVAEVLSVPLWLWIATTLDRDRAKQLTTVTSSDDAEQILTDAYLDRTIAALDDTVQFGFTSCRRFLAAIAGFLTNPRSPDTTTFRLENLTPPHPAPTQSRAVAAVAGLLGGTLFGPANHLLVRRGGEQTEADGRPARSQVRWPGIRSLLRKLVFGLVFGLAGVVVGLAQGLVGVLVFGLLGLTGGLVGGVAGALVASTPVVASDRIDEGYHASKASLTLHVTTYGLAYGLFVGLAYGLLIEWAFGLLPGLIFGLIAGPVGVLVAGLVGGLEHGGWYLFMQHRVRRQAERQGLLPHDVVFFLQSAVGVRVLRRTGGGVQFRHRALLDRLAPDAPEPGLADLRQRIGTEEQEGRRPVTRSAIPRGG